MVPINLEKALFFIDEHANIQDKARLLFLMLGEVPPGHITKPLLDKQNADGGFPSRPHGENPSSVDSTLTAIWQMNEVGMISSSEAEHAFQFLISSQRSDGSWDENPALAQHDLPPWIVPGKLATQLYLSAYSAYWLGLSAHNNHISFRRAIEFLSSQQDPDGTLPGYMHTQWIASGAFLLAGKPYHDQARMSIMSLQKRPLNQWEDSQIAWALDCLGSAGLDDKDHFVASLLAELSDRQEPGGGWASEDGPAYSVSATISAIKAFKMFGWIDLYH